MKLNSIKPKKALNLEYRKYNPKKNKLNDFRTELKNCLQVIKDAAEAKETEEFMKTPIATFFKNTFYNKNLVNTKKDIDLAIFTGIDLKSDVGVIIETKKPSNKTEFLNQDSINKKALQQLLLYYLQERIDFKNINIKTLIATNGYEWYFFKGEDFYKYFYKKDALVKEYKEWKNKQKDSSKTDSFYNDIAKKYITEIEKELPFIYYDFRENVLDKFDNEELKLLFKTFSDVNLLGKSFGNDSNALNKEFYNELLHIIGLEEKKDKGKKIIYRKDEDKRDYESLLEDAIYTLETKDHLQNVTRYKVDKAFNAGLALTLSWVNRVLFLKLLESQLKSYHPLEKEKYSFLNTKFINGYDDLNDLFFDALAIKQDERHVRYKEKFKNIPYLNSSLFEKNELEKSTFDISSLNGGKLEVYSKTVLKEENGKRFKGKLSTLEYLFRFLDCFDFATDSTYSSSDEEETKTLINASVLGKIFEKINGYKEGSFYTPAYITMYMCKETLRRAVVQKFKEKENEDIETFEDLVFHCTRAKNLDDIKRLNNVFYSLKVCDPAVGSGHFLVSALNELIVIKHELGLIIDARGGSLARYDIHIENDELYVEDEDGDLIEYKTTNKESARVQCTLFQEKQRIIENCLFGVDINPNSVKICRLRLWIELLKNAYYTKSGVFETLPNIDINIKCGNSLISRFDLQDDLKDAFKGKDVKYSFKEYRDAVKQYKQSNSKKEKKEVIEIIKVVKNNFTNSIEDTFITKISKARGEYENLNTLLNIPSLLGDKVTKQDKQNYKKAKGKLQKLETQRDEILNNVIYDNAFEWRFEFPEVLDEVGNYIGFDAVIGNPPYGVSIKGKEREHLISSISKVPDYEIYYWFIDRSAQILKNLGNCSYIIPNSILFNVFAQNYRLNLFDNWEINEILDCTDFQIFSEATVRNIIFHLTKKRDTKNLGYRNTMSVESFPGLLNKERLFVKKDVVKFNNKNWGLIFKLPQENLDLVKKIRTDRLNLNFCFPETTQGIIPYDKYKGQSEEVIKSQAYHSNIKTKPTQGMWLQGGDVKKYNLTWNKVDWLDYCDGLANPRQPHFFEGKRILIREITSPTIIATITSDLYYNGGAVLIIKDNEDSLIPIEAVLGVLNSKLATFYHFNSSPKASKGAFPKVLVVDVNTFPLPKEISNNLNIELVKSVNQILTRKKENPDADTTALEQEIDQIVYKLYGLNEEEVRIVEGS